MTYIIIIKYQKSKFYTMNNLISLADTMLAADDLISNNNNEMRNSRTQPIVINRLPANNLQITPTNLIQNPLHQLQSNPPTGTPSHLLNNPPIGGLANPIPFNRPMETPSISYPPNQMQFCQPINSRVTTPNQLPSNSQARGGVPLNQNNRPFVRPATTTTTTTTTENGCFSHFRVVEKEKKEQVRKSFQLKKCLESFYERASSRYRCRLCTEHTRLFISIYTVERHIEDEHKAIVDDTMANICFVETLAGSQRNRDGVKMKRCDHLNCGMLVDEPNFSQHYSSNHHCHRPDEKSNCVRCKAVERKAEKQTIEELLNMSATTVKYTYNNLLDISVRDMARTKLVYQIPDEKWKDYCIEMKCDTKYYSLTRIKKYIKEISSKYMKELSQSEVGTYLSLQNSLALVIEMDIQRGYDTGETVSMEVKGEMKDVTPKLFRIGLDNAKMNKNNKFSQEIGVLQSISINKPVPVLKSPNDGLMFLVYLGDETFSELKQQLAKLNQEIKELESNNNIFIYKDRYYQIDLLYTFDLKCWLTVMGLGGLFHWNSTFRCPTCLGTGSSGKVDPDTQEKIDHSTIGNVAGFFEPRTRELMRKEGQRVKDKLEKSKAKNPKVEMKSFSGLAAEPSLDIDPTKVPPDTLHMIMSIVKTVFKPILLLCDTNETLRKDIEDFLKCKAKLTLITVSPGTLLHGQPYTFYDRFKQSAVNYMEYINILINQDILIKTLSNHSVYNNDKLELIKKYWKQLHCLISCMISDEPVKEYQWRYMSSQFGSNLILADIKISTYMHIFIVHVGFFLERYGNLERFATFCIEYLHKPQQQEQQQEQQEQLQEQQEQQEQHLSTSFPPPIVRDVRESKRRKMFDDRIEKLRQMIQQQSSTLMQQNVDALQRVLEEQEKQQQLSEAKKITKDLTYQLIERSINMFFINNEENSGNVNESDHAALRRQWEELRKIEKDRQRNQHFNVSNFNLNSLFGIESIEVAPTDFNCKPKFLLKKDNTYRVAFKDEVIANYYSVDYITRQSATESISNDRMVEGRYQFSRRPAEITIIQNYQLGQRGLED
ncbi:hypothetical protein PPL_07082 [Heterostelium album PN500]|uniref:Uncharacterized protein n=1 Tax=Heterostelium pallidum (strain ATCC 26659 / Pp 5 / PN500) TaxID=670386 RepID=D3BEC6_HETP5|nr:hypothetical protein PPL_07082 [Heterostelium album PN500]EFA80257.1 hypothetical protein PPL_07082 [Heterostelium album PN500]|eukprot:XP_020432377.1 hypothetical protein PPL_07082 [Heterostelium album PN500]